METVANAESMVWLLKPPYIVLTIGFLVALDMYFRWVAYARYDSIVVDACIFSAVLVLIEIFHSGNFVERVGLIPTFILEILLILIAIVYHRHLDLKAKHQAEKLLDNVNHKLLINRNKNLPNSKEKC